MLNLKSLQQGLEESRVRPAKKRADSEKVMKNYHDKKAGIDTSVKSKQPEIIAKIKMLLSNGDKRPVIKDVIISEFKISTQYFSVLWGKSI